MMKGVSLTIYGVAITLAVLWVRCNAEAGCPKSKDIQPCSCIRDEDEGVVLQCENITDSEFVRRAFRNSDRHSYKEVRIYSSTFPYLEKDFFEGTPVYSLYLKDVNMHRLFDEQPDTLSSLETLNLFHTRFMSRIRWKLLEPLDNLTELIMMSGSVQVIDRDFDRYVSKKLINLIFIAMQTKIRPGAFRRFKNLEGMQISSCKVTKLSRDMFPDPFNVKHLDFSGNKLTTIPDDLFTNMPELESLNLSANRIAVIPESAFEGSPQEKSLMIYGNPLKCDCRITWLLRVKSWYSLTGACESPKELHGKDLAELSLEDFEC